MEQLFQKQNSLRVLDFFFGSPYKEIHLRELARRIKMAPSTVSRCLAVLVESGLVAKRRERNGAYFVASGGPYFRAFKVARTLARISAANAVDLIAAKSRGLSSVLLYGSAARGEDDAESDYDFLIIATSCSAAPLELGRKLGRECSLQVYSAAGWKETSRKNRAFYLEVIGNSVPLHGKKPVID